MPLLISLNLPLRRRGVALLDDSGDAAARPDDAAVAVGAVDDGRDHGRCGAGASVGLDEAPQRRRPSAAARRPTAGPACPAVPASSGSACCRAWAVPSCGSWTTKPDIRASAHGRTHRIGAVADDERDRGGRDRFGGAEDVLDQRLAGESVQHLGQPDFIRVPWPAARMTTWTSWGINHRSSDQIS